jgi:hypothetical protein
MWRLGGSLALPGDLVARWDGAFWRDATRASIGTGRRRFG